MVHRDVCLQFTVSVSSSKGYRTHMARFSVSVTVKGFSGRRQPCIRTASYSRVVCTYNRYVTNEQN